MSDEISNTISESIKTLESLEVSEVQACQKKILEELYALRESLAKAKPGNGGDSGILDGLYEFRETLKDEILASREMQNQLMRRTERVGHLKKNFKKIFDDNVRLRKENEELKKALEEKGGEAQEE